MFQCNICGARFSLKQNLARHLRDLHEERGTFECRECGKNYSTKNNLQRHMTVHSKRPRLGPTQQLQPEPGLDTYMCTHCKKSFALRENLVQHIESHNESGSATAESLRNNTRTNGYCNKLSEINANVDSYSDEDRKLFPLLPQEKNIKQSPSDDESSTCYLEKRKLPETEETKSLLTSELERLVLLLEQLQFYRNAGRLVQLNKDQHCNNCHDGIYVPIIS